MTIPPVDQSTNITNSQALIVRPSENPDLGVRRRYEELFLRTYSALHLGGKETLESRMIRKLSMSAPTHSAEEMGRRLSQYEKAHPFLEGLSQDQFASLLASATSISRGWGDILSLTVNGVPVIVKKICLTQEEMQHQKSTRNFFDLPS
ncbi:MAG: hypothetical protein FJZ61_06260 [Chlamydiae bacterium]|nr:hypothetical protein [Chlamydiota bacterium]